MVADSIVPEDDVIHRVQQEQLKETLWRCVDGLEGRQPDVIRKRYIDNKTLNEIAEDYGVSRERIRQEEAKGLRELRKPRNQKWLKPYLDDVRSSAMCGVGVEHFRRTWTSATEYTAMRLFDNRIK